MFSLLFHYSFFCWVFWIIFIFDERSTMSKKSSMPSVCRVFACHIFVLFLLLSDSFLFETKGLTCPASGIFYHASELFLFFKCDLNTDLCSVYLPFQSNKGTNKTRDQWMHKRDHHPIQCCFSITRALSTHFRFNCHFYREGEDGEE